MLRAGAAEVEITLEPGAWLAGYSARTQPSTGVHDQLYARALFLESGAQRVALAVADVIGCEEQLVARVRDGIEREAGIPASHIMLAATHTHSGPFLACLRPLAPVDLEATERLASGMIEAVVAAARGAREARIGAGFADVSIGVNRRLPGAEGRIRLEPNPDGPVDRRVGVLRVDGTDGTICVLVNHGCHGVVLEADNLLCSADWPGAAARALRKAVDGIAIVANGACGDVNPIERGGFDAVERMGRCVADAGLAVLPDIELSADVEIRVASRPVSLPTRGFTVEEAQQVSDRLQADMERARTEDNAGALRACEMALPWTQWMAGLAASGAQPEPAASEIQAIAMDDIALLGLPGEVFCEIGMNIIAASPFRHTFIIGYANRSVGYLPTRRALEEGGYEVEGAPRWYGFAPFAPDVQDIIEGTALELLKLLK